MTKKKEATKEREYLCFDRMIGVHFKADEDSVFKAIDAINSRIKRNEFVTLNEFYHEINLPGIPIGNQFKIEGLKAQYGPIDGKQHIIISYAVIPCIYFAEKLEGRN